MARGEFVLNIGDDNVVLTRFVDGKVANAWLGSPDPALAHEELGEALAQDTKGRISVLFDTLDQSFKEEEIPKVGVLDRRKLLARHINMAFPGANLRGARLVKQTDKKTLIYEMASVPLDGRVPGWLDVLQSLPNEKGGIYTIAAESVDIVAALAPKDATAPETGNHWRHFIGINVTGGLRQIIEKNGRLSLTRLTQAPPAETSPEDFADMIVRDFKATITYIRRLGYQVGDTLDLIVLTTADNKAALEDITWDGARSVSVYTPYEAGHLLNLGSLGREDQAYCDVLLAAWFASKRKGVLALTRAAAMGDTTDDIRDLAFFLSPYAAAAAVAGLVLWSGWTGYELYDYSDRNSALQGQLTQVRSFLDEERGRLGALPYDVDRVRNVIQVADTLDAGKVDFIPLVQRVANSLDGDAVVLNLELVNTVQQSTAARGGNATRQPPVQVKVDLRLASVISTADEAVQVARRLEQRLNAQFAPDYKVTMTSEPVGAQAAEGLSGSLTGAASSETNVSEDSSATGESFYAAFTMEKVGS